MKKLKVKFNKEKSYWEIFMPDGQKLPAMTKVSIDDNWGVKDNCGNMTATFTCFIDLEI